MAAPSRVTKYFLLFVALVQFYQMYMIHTITADQHQAKSQGLFTRSLSTSTVSSPHNHLRSKTSILATRLDTSQASGSSQEQKQKDESFSACLMIMDDNAHLIEWLAYHYTRLPLRRLIVAVDPRSQTSPSEILQRWEGRMHITEWGDVDFMPPTLMDRHKQIEDDDHEGLTDLFRQRQVEFYTRCMARLKYEGHTWTTFIDTDEYMVINENAQGQHKIPVSHSGSNGQSMTILEGIHRAQHDNKFLAQEFFQSPCVAMARLAFGVKESTPEQISSGVPFFGFDGHDFQTMQWRWHAGRGMKKVNKISKSILDVSRVDSELFVPTEQVMVHLPSKTHCHGGEENHLRVLNSYSPIIVHHYAGTWEQWSHRKDTRGRRTRENYEKLMFDKKSDDSIRLWLQEFVNQVGLWQARGLLWDVGVIPSVE